MGNPTLVAALSVIGPAAAVVSVSAARLMDCAAFWGRPKFTSTDLAATVSLPADEARTMSSAVLRGVSTLPSTVADPLITEYTMGNPALEVAPSVTGVLMIMPLPGELNEMFCVVRA